LSARSDHWIFGYIYTSSQQSTQQRHCEICKTYDQYYIHKQIKKQWLKAELYYTDVDTGDLKRREIYLRYLGDDDKYGKHMDEEIKNQLKEFGILDYYTQDGLRRVSGANKIRPRKKGMKAWNSGLSWDNEAKYFKRYDCLLDSKKGTEADAAKTRG
jgi:hypothetical protein